MRVDGIDGIVWLVFLIAASMTQPHSGERTVECVVHKGCCVMGDGWLLVAC